MPDLEDRFRSLARTAAPDLWPAAQRREPSPAPTRGAGRRLPIAVTALVLAIAGFAVSVRAFTAGTSAPPNSPPPTDTIANGPIYFRAGGGDGPSRIEAVEADGTGQRVVFDGDPLLHVTQIAWSPDGSRIAYLDAIPAERGIYVANPDGSDPVRLTHGANDAWPSWAPDGTKIVFSGSADNQSLRTCEPGADFRCPTDIYVIDADGTDLTRLTDDPAPEYQPAWSPNGDRIAFVRSSGGTAGEAPLIFAMNVDGSDIRQVSSGEGGSDSSPSWSPDGSRITFVGFRFENTGIWIVDANGSNEHQIVGQDWYFVQDPVWSPAGDLIAFAGSPSDAALYEELYVIDPDGGNVLQLAEAPGWGVAGDIAWQPLVAGLPPDEPSPVPAEPASVEVRVTTTHGVAEFPSAVAAGEGGVWVTAPRNDGSTGGDLVRLDPLSGQVVARIPVRAAPGWDFGGAGLTVAEGSVWVVDSVGSGPACCHAFVTRVDPSTDTVADEIELPGEVAFGADVWVDGSSMYVLSFGQGEDALELAMVDVATHATEWRVPVPGQWSQTVFVAGGSVWVLGTQPDAHGPIEVDMLYRLDPATGVLLGQIAFKTSIYIPVIEADTIWFRTEDGAQRFDATSGEFIGEPVKPAPGCCTGAFVSDGADGVWVMSSPGAGVERSIWHIDASGAVVATGTIEDRNDFEQMMGQSYAFDPGTQTIWVQHYADSVSRVEILPVASAG
jgi:hypothetical protein